MLALGLLPMSRALEAGALILLLSLAVIIYRARETCLGLAVDGASEISPIVADRSVQTHKGLQCLRSMSEADSGSGEGPEKWIVADFQPAERRNDDTECQA